MKKNLLLFALVFSAFFTTNLQAQVAGDFQSAGSGDWNNVATWARYDGAAWVTPAPSFPTNTEGAVTVLAGHTVGITAAITLDSVTIATGGTVNINSGVTVTCPTNNAGGAIMDINNQGTLNVSGRLLATGTGLVRTSGGTTTFMSGSTYEHNENGGSIPTSTWASGSTCLITGVTTTNPSNANQKYYDFTWNCTGQTAGVNIGWFDPVDPSTPGYVAFLHVAGTLRLIQAGTNPSSAIFSTGALRLSNNLANGGSPVIMTVNNISAEGNILTTNGSSGVQTYTLNVLGNLTLGNLGVFNVSNGSGGDATINLKGDLIFNSSFTSAYAGGLTTKVRKTIFSKPGVQGVQNYIKTAGGIGTNHQFEVASGTTLNVANYSIANGGGSFTLNSGAGLICSGVGGFNENFTSTTQTLSFASDANYTFNASAGNQTVGTKFGAAVSACNNFTVNNTSPIGNDTLKLTSTVGGLKINGALTLTKGIILPNTTASLTLSPTATVVGGSNTSHVAKKLIREVESTIPYLFPIGKGGYNPITVTPTSVAPPFTPTVFEAEYFNVPYSNLTSFTAPTTGVSNLGYFDLGRVSGALNAKVQFTLAGLGVPGTAAADDIGLGHFVSGAWKWEGGTGVTTGTATTGNVVSNEVTSFSPFALVALPDGTLSPTPLNFLAFNGRLNNSQVDLTWTTTNEINTKEFRIERSNDGKSFTEIGTVTAANTTGDITYNFTDTRLSNSDFVYYKLKQIDLNGAFTYSKIVPLKLKNTKQLFAFPNPAKDEVSITFSKAKENSYLMVYNAIGSLLEKILITEGTTQKVLDVSAYTNGIYQIVITDGVNIQKTQIVKIN